MRLILTRTVASSPWRDEIIKAVAEFNNFNSDNDPYEEHDFGSFNVKGINYFFKFDYFDEESRYFKEDGNRVLTVMEASEY